MRTAMHLSGVALLIIVPLSGLACWPFNPPDDAATPGAGFYALGDLPDGNVYSAARAISADGSVIVGEAASADGIEAFRWTQATGMTPLGDLPGGEYASRALGVSGDGTIIVGESGSELATWVGSPWEAFRWTESSGMTALGDLPTGRFSSTALAVSRDSSVIVGYGLVSEPPVSLAARRAFVWTTVTGLIQLADETLEATGASADGAVIVGSAQFGSIVGAFRWTQESGAVAINNLSSDTSRAIAVSADGRVVAGVLHAASVRQAWRWSAETGLLPLGGMPDSEALAISDDGTTIVGWGYVGPDPATQTDWPDGQQAFIWTASAGSQPLMDVLRTRLGLDLTGWTLRAATGVSADGKTVVGWGINPSGATEAWFATLP